MNTPLAERIRPKNLDEYLRPKAPPWAKRFR